MGKPQGRCLRRLWSLWSLWRDVACNALEPWSLGGALLATPWSNAKGSRKQGVASSRRKDEDYRPNQRPCKNKISSGSILMTLCVTFIFDWKRSPFHHG